ncbi:MAG: sulfatase-like hydrolase/transferase [Verrucomicrobia bacterium]|nr:sulfatase-like hydrolase/transferase [Verrucomicrobiota bacterium]
MKIRLPFLAIAVLFALGASAPIASAAPRPPNVILILMDDLGQRDLGCYGSKFYRTPHIDRMAKDGMLFTDAYAACPVCSPTRASIMTGKYPARLHLTDWLPGRGDKPEQKLNRPVINQQLALEEETIAEVLKRAGYVTGHIGKWHLGGPGFEPEKQGFDSNVAGDVTGTPASYFAPFKGKGRDGTERFMPGLEKSEPGEYLTDRLTTEAEKFIEANKSKPFFLYFAHFAVHIPLKAKADVIAKYPVIADKPGTQTNVVYAAMVESMDDSVGRVLKKLDDLKLSENTLVIFTSDNGGLCTLEGAATPATINAPLREGKGFLYEGGIREPLLVKWTGVVRPGTTNSTPVCSIDFFPTILEAAGAPSTASARTQNPKAETVLGAPIDGVSLMPLLKGTGQLKPRALYWHYPHYSNQGGKPGAAIREGEWKLIEFYENGRWELYNVGKSVSESANLIEKEPAIAAKLGKKLDDWRIATGAQMMMPNPDFVPNPQADDGSITLPAKWAEVHGATLRYEPMPHKNTLGFWTQPTDWAEWEFTVTKPGAFIVEPLQGCGKGNGGSEVEFTVAGQTLTMTVEDTGHFQNFKPREIGTVNIVKPGRYTLAVKPKTKAKAAVMDLRQVTLKPAK